MNDVTTQTLPGHGGAPLAVHRLGEGRPVLLLHGLFSSAEVNWIKYGHAARIAASGCEVIMPDLRGHGASAAPHGSADWPPDVLALDVAALVGELGLADYDLGGFSLGARTAVRAVLHGLAPARLVLGGMGLEGLTGWARRSAHFLSVIDRFGSIGRDEPEYFIQSFMKTMKIDIVAARLLLQSVEDTDVSALAGLTMPCLVVCGDEDRDNGSAPALANALPHATYAEIPGTHMGCVTRRELGEAIAGFLS